MQHQINTRERKHHEQYLCDQFIISLLLFSSVCCLFFCFPPQASAQERAKEICHAAALRDGINWDKTRRQIVCVVECACLLARCLSANDNFSFPAPNYLRTAKRSKNLFLLKNMFTKMSEGRKKNLQGMLASSLNKFKKPSPLAFFAWFICNLSMRFGSEKGDKQKVT